MRFSFSTRGRRSVVTAIAVFVSFSACLTALGQVAAGPSDREVARRFLEELWSKGRDSRTEAQQLFSQTPHTPAVLAAYTIQRMRQNRNREAAEVAKEWAKAKPDDPVARFTTAWLSAVTDDFDRALVELRGWAEAIQKQPLPADLQDVIFRQVGRMMGYLEGPVADRVNRDLLIAAEDAIRNALPPDQWKIVDEQRTETLGEYRTYTAQKDAVHQEEMQKAIAKAEQERKALEQQNEMLQKRFDSLGTERQQIESDVSNRVAQLESQALPLQQSAASLAAQIDSLNAELQRLIVQLTILQNQACDRPNDRYLRFLIVDMNYRLSDLEYQRSIALANYQSVMAQLNELDRQAAMVRQEGMARVEQLRDEADEIQRRLRWNQKKLVKLAQPPKVSSAKAGAIDNRATALTSYAPFPLELVRAYLIRSL